WTDREPGADALHHPGHVPLSGSLLALGQQAVGAGAPGQPPRRARAGANMKPRRALPRPPGVLAGSPLAGCAVGPNYHRPPAANPQHFKEAEGWKPAEPRA